MIVPRLPLHIRSQIPDSHFYFSCSGYLRTGLENQTGTFSAGLVLFLPFNKRKHQGPAVVQDEQHALGAMSAACPGSDEGYRHAGLCLPVGPRPAGRGE